MTELISLPRKWQGLKKNVMQTKLRGAFLVIVHNGGKCGSHMWLWQRNFYQTKIGFCDSPAHKKKIFHIQGVGGGGRSGEGGGREENRPKNCCTFCGVLCSSVGFEHLMEVH